MRVDTPNPLWASCVLSVQAHFQSLLIAASFRPGGDISATIISLIFPNARHLRVGPMKVLNFSSKAQLEPSQSQSPIV